VTWSFKKRLAADWILSRVS